MRILFNIIVSSILFFIYVNFIPLNSKKWGRKKVVVERKFFPVSLPKEHHYWVMVVLGGVVVTVIMQVEKDEEGLWESSTFHNLNVDKNISENLSPIIFIVNTKQDDSRG